MVKTGKPGKPCPCCSRGGHRLMECDRFKLLKTYERWKLAEQKSLCRTCLNNNGNWPCRSWKGCEIENFRHKHHTLLHAAPSNSLSTGMTASHLSTDQLWIFRIVSVVLHAKIQKLSIFAFIDEGSLETLIEETMAKQLNNRTNRIIDVTLDQKCLLRGTELIANTVKYYCKERRGSSWSSSSCTYRELSSGSVTNTTLWRNGSTFPSPTGTPHWRLQRATQIADGIQQYRLMPPEEIVVRRTSWIAGRQVSSWMEYLRWHSF